MKRALITGGSSGLGYCLSRRFQASDYEVHTISRRSTAPPGCICHSLDLADADAVSAFAEDFSEKYQKLDLLINNAALSDAGLLVKFAEADFDRTLSVDFTAARILTEQLRPLLKGGTVINVVSRVGKEGRAGLCGYATAKGMLLGYTLGAAEEFRNDNVRLLAVNPGFMVTPMVLEKTIEIQRNESVLGAISTPEASADFIVWLSQQGFASGALYDFDSRIYHAWN